MCELKHLKKKTENLLGPDTTRQWITRKHIFDEHKSKVTKEVRARSKI